VVGVAFAQPGEELADVGLGDVGERRTAAGVEQLGVSAQVPPVGRQGVGREATLDGEVVEIRPDRRVDRGAGRQLQRSTASSATESSPCASATDG